MNFLNKLERKFGKYAIPNLSLWLICGYGIGYVFYFLNPQILNWLTLEPYYILHGQVWRLISWVLLPNDTNLLSAIIMMIFYYQLGRALEQTWGTFRFNVYIWSGLIFTVLGAFLVYGIEYAAFGMAMPLGYISTKYINNAIFLAFALCYPDMEILLYFILPIKMKWMALVYAALTVYEFIFGSWPTRMAIAAALISFVVFFFSTRNYQHISPQQRRVRKKYRAQTRQDSKMSGIAKHKCAICGRTDLTNPELEFRFCSKCAGNYEYCQDHLFTHEHKK
ncbi:MAG: rhomboid family intramembrane serine protease [Lachnospiraceae bacterium]